MVSADLQVGDPLDVIGLISCRTIRPAGGKVY